MRRDATGYIRLNFDPEDRLAVVLIQQEGEDKGKVEQKFYSAVQAAGPRVQAYLRYKNAHGWDVYASANPLKPGARRRGKSDVLEARWLYLDADENGDAILERIDADAASERIPAPTAVVNTSPGRYQVLWRIEPTETSKAEAMLRGLAHLYGTDRAATDCNRVLRLPGFRSRKRGVPVRLLRYSQGPPSKLGEFSGNLALPEYARPSGEPDRRPGQPRACEADESYGGDWTKSGEDWAWTREQLRRGRKPTEVEAELAARHPAEARGGAPPGRGRGPGAAQPDFHVLPGVGCPAEPGGRRGGCGRGRIGTIRGARDLPDRLGPAGRRRVVVLGSELPRRLPRPPRGGVDPGQGLSGRRSRRSAVPVPDRRR